MAGDSEAGWAGGGLRCWMGMSRAAGALRGMSVSLDRSGLGPAAGLRAGRGSPGWARGARGKYPRGGTARPDTQRHRPASPAPPLQEAGSGGNKLQLGRAGRESRIAALGRGRCLQPASVHQSQLFLLTSLFEDPKRE
ncbi:unnamed protein product [Natator depressus]